jgi:hypothetical protein
MAARERQDQVQATLTTLAQSQATATSHLSRLEPLELTVRAIIPLLEASERNVTQFIQTQQQANELIRRLAEGGETRHRELLNTLTNLYAAAHARQEQVQRDHDALRNAMAAYLNPTR